MAEEIKLAKIQKVSFGRGGYHDSCIGIIFDLGSDGWGVGDFWGGWGGKRSDYSKWTEEDRIRSLGETVMMIDRLLSDAKVETVDELVGIPIRVYFRNFNTLDRWEVLKEVI